MEASGHIRLFVLITLKIQFLSHTGHIWLVAIILRVKLKEISITMESSAKQQWPTEN